MTKSEREARAAILRKQQAVARELRAMAQRLDASFRRVKFHEHPPFRVGLTCWG